MKKIIIIIMLSSLNAFAAERGFYASASAAGGVNPKSADISAEVYYKIPLSSDPGILRESTCIDFGFSGEATPADYNSSCFINIEPIAFFSLKLSATIEKFYTSLNYGYRQLASLKSDYSASALSDIDTESKTAYKYSAEPALKIKYRRIIATDSFTLNHVRVLTSDDYYYDPHSDTPHKKNDWDYSNSTSILFSVNSHILAGVNNCYSRTASADSGSDRIAGIALISPGQENSGSLTIGTLAGSYTKNRNYKGDLFCAVFAEYTFKP